MQWSKVLVLEENWSDVSKRGKISEQKNGYLFLWGQTWQKYNYKHREKSQDINTYKNNSQNMGKTFSVVPDFFFHNNTITVIVFFFLIPLGVLGRVF